MGRIVERESEIEAELARIWDGTVATWFWSSGGVWVSGFSWVRVLGSIS